MDKVDSSTASLLQPSFYPNLKPEIKKAKDKQDIRKGRKLRFQEILESSAPAREFGPLRELAASEEALTELMDAVHSAGSDLNERPFSNEILQYKKAVRNFINYIVKNSYKMQQVQGLKKKVVVHGETKWKDVVYHQIQVIDQKLEELAAAILSGQMDQLKRVSKLEEITGLLVDLTITGVIKERDE